MNLLTIDKSWALFLDRDGVINQKKKNGYITSIDEFHFITGTKEAIASFSKCFGRIFIVTNQQCIRKGILSEVDLNAIHKHMLTEIEATGGRIDRVYFAPQLAEENSKFRKPGIGMALQAKNDFPEIDYSKSVMIGDTISDLEFGRKMGSKTIFIAPNQHKWADFNCKNLADSMLVFKGLH